MITGRQIRAARALLDMSQDELAAAAGLTPQGLRKIESGEVQPREGTLADITKVFDLRGLEFTEHQGVRFRPNNLEIFEGSGRFDDFYDFLYQHLLSSDGDICLNIYDETLLARYRKNPEIHRKRMKDLAARGTLSFRIITTISNFDSHGYAQFRYQPQTEPNPTGFYAFGDCLALMSFVDPKSPYVVVIKSAPLTEGYRQGFNASWEKSPLPPTQREGKA